MNYQLNVPISETELQTVMEKQNRLRARLLAFREQESSRCRTLPIVESESTKLKAHLLNETAMGEKQNYLLTRLLAFRKQESSGLQVLPSVESEFIKLKAHLLNEAAIREFRKKSEINLGNFNRSNGSSRVTTVHKTELNSNKVVPENVPLTNIINENSYNLKPMIDLNCLSNNSSHAYVSKELPVLEMSGAHSVRSAQGLLRAENLNNRVDELVVAVTTENEIMPARANRVFEVEHSCKNDRVDFVNLRTIKNTELFYCSMESKLENNDNQSLGSNIDSTAWVVSKGNNPQNDRQHTFYKHYCYNVNDKLSGSRFSGSDFVRNIFYIMFYIKGIFDLPIITKNCLRFCFHMTAFKKDIFKLRLKKPPDKYKLSENKFDDKNFEYLKISANLDRKGLDITDLFLILLNIKESKDYLMLMYYMNFIYIEELLCLCKRRHETDLIRWCNWDNWENFEYHHQSLTEEHRGVKNEFSKIISNGPSSSTYDVKSPTIGSLTCINIKFIYVELFIFINFEDFHCLAETVGMSSSTINTLKVIAESTKKQSFNLKKILIS